METLKRIKASLVGVLALVAVITFSQGAGAYELLGYEWPGSHPIIPVYVSTSLDGNIPYDGTFQDAIEDVQLAIDEWNTAGGSNFEFFYAGTTSVDTVADDGINVITFESGQCTSGSTCGAAAFNHHSGGLLHGFDIVIYSHETSGILQYWATSDIIWAWDHDFQGTVTHELGHGLGLGHSSVAQSVMGLSCGVGCAGNRDLSLDDALGVQFIYGSFSCNGISPSSDTVVAGETFSLNLRYPEGAQKPFMILLSFYESPTFQMSAINPIDSRDLRINPNFFPTQNHPQIFTNFVGVLDANGEATATVNVPAGVPSGFQMHFSAVTFDPSIVSGVEDVGRTATVTVN